MLRCVVKAVTVFDGVMVYDARDLSIGHVCVARDEPGGVAGGVAVKRRGWEF